MMHILLVEDDPRMVRFMKRGLEAEHHTLQFARDLDECLMCLSTTQFDIVIVDVYLRHADGLEICQAVRHHGGSIPILLLTAHATCEAASRCPHPAITDCLAQPFAFDELLEKISTLVSGALAKSWAAWNGPDQHTTVTP